MKYRVERGHSEVNIRYTIKMLHDSPGDAFVLFETDGDVRTTNIILSASDVVLHKRS